MFHIIFRNSYTRVPSNNYYTILFFFKTYKPEAHVVKKTLNSRNILISAPFQLGEDVY